MPNTLAHLGAQTLLTRTLLPAADARWIALGCVLPDLPWIAARAATWSGLGLDPYALRLYAVVQSSLLVSWMGAAGLALLSRRPRHTLAVLALGCALHLLLDALQIKWGNGVLLLAPASFAPWSLGLFWPDSPQSYALTALGAAVALRELRRPAGPPAPRPSAAVARARAGEPERARHPVGVAGGGGRVPAAALPLAGGGWRVPAAALLLAGYAVLPLAWLDGPRSADAHFVATLEARDQRAGAPVALDRVPYRADPDGEEGAVETFGGERVRCVEGCPPTDGHVSLRGLFVDEHSLRADALRVHVAWIRDASSYAGLGVVVWLWLRGLPRRKPR